MTTTLCICADTEDLAERSARHIAESAAAAVATRGQFTISLSGGETPIPTYVALGGRLADQMPWSHVHVFWGDERCIPLDRPDNHFTLASGPMLSRVRIPADQVHRIRAEAEDPAAAAQSYERELKKFFAASGDGWPVFDLVVLGMGEDGHVASLFPGSPGLAERKRWVVDHHVVKRGERVRRVTLTMPVLTAAREVLLLVAGDIKAGMIAAVLNGEADVPAHEVNARAASVVWMVDPAAAAELKAERTADERSPV
jgi:6-phosphogluconolactonase